MTDVAGYRRRQSVIVLFGEPLAAYKTHDIVKQPKTRLWPRGCRRLSIQAASTCWRRRSTPVPPSPFTPCPAPPPTPKRAPVLFKQVYRIKIHGFSDREVRKNGLGWIV